ncbi:hypothetical protein GWI33_017130 [Rhynchophorus ferrugineus]|uniref:Uncharacterized protein n=1 Tax=Rhynchophorus ferrugineus TaxID=354439 RepID=A0A834M7Y6_RHYFE|nr:hypothetical protein GWI33_017130 [Rhynchophorus ferrugineus]
MLNNILMKKKQHLTNPKQAEQRSCIYHILYSGYYSPIGFEEQNPNFINLQQAIARLRQAFIDNNDLENENSVDQTVSDLLDVSRLALENWFYYYEQELKSALTSRDLKVKNASRISANLMDGQFENPDKKRSEIYTVRRSGLNKFVMDRGNKRKADFGSQRDATGKQAQELRYLFHIG